MAIAFRMLPLASAGEKVSNAVRLVALAACDEKGGSLARVVLGSPDWCVNPVPVNFEHVIVFGDGS